MNELVVADRGAEWREVRGKLLLRVTSDSPFHVLPALLSSSCLNFVP
jgi:hypothetical protein